MSTSYQSEVLDHLGLVAAMYDELGIGELIDQLIPQDTSKRHISLGQAVKAMVLNGLGFVNQRLYLVPHFFANKPVERLLGPGIEAAHLNDDVLGRALDHLYDYGVTALFCQVASQAAQRLGLASRSVHLDTTSFHVDGQGYDDYPAPDPADAALIDLTHGYSRDHRPDLPQVILELVVENQAGLPLRMQAISGNQPDAQTFGDTVQAHVGQLAASQPFDYLVADAAFYNEATLQAVAGAPWRWVSRVPATLSATKTLLNQLSLVELTELAPGYRYVEVGAWYADVPQRWLLIHSEAAAQRARHTVAKQAQRASEREMRAFLRLTRQEFACADDALAAGQAFSQTLQWSTLSDLAVERHARYEQPGRPAQDAQPSTIHYRLTATIASSLLVRDDLWRKKSCFILATNQLDAQVLPPAKILATYKSQDRVERGFRFLKDPQFLASALFLKSPARLMALLMVMTLCLLVYAALEFRVRQALQETAPFFPDQKGKPTLRPSARWVFHVFVGIHLLTLDTKQQLVLNLRPLHQQLLELLGAPYQAIYSS